MRRRMRWLLPALLAAAAPLAGQTGQCSWVASTNGFLVNGATTSSTPLGGSVTVTVISGTSCAWYPTTTATWIHIPALQYTATGTFSFTIDDNTGTSLRQATIVINTPAGVFNISVIQLTATCVYSVSPTNALFSAGGGTGSMQVTTGCAWTSSTSAGWLTSSYDSGNLNSPAANYGNGKVNYTVASNTCVASRTAALNLQTGTPGAPALTVTQAGSNSNLTISPASLTTSSAATTGRIIVTTGDGCPWSATSDSSWLQITGSASGSGFSSFAYSILANPGPARTGNITVGPATFTVTQQATPPPPIQITAIVNGASYAQGAISPGEIVALFGSNMGPASGAPYQLSSDGKSIPSTLAGVQLMFGSAPAPLLYVSAGQINAIVPYGVTPGNDVAVQLQYQGQINTVTVPVASASPGIFSADRSGFGPGAILNQDSSLNATLSPAAAGSVIQIFATGGGLVSPSVSDGFLAPAAEPLPRIPGTVPVTVIIGGLRSPQVTYAGDAPGLVAGLTQIDAVVPPGVASGTSVPVVVQIGAAQSQNGITITVQ
ncbi:MAG TPA: BACON domain-containing carbohydrate-binding protein [Verrucomicrobiae bacterium]|nr:BACON domain-containing carbohydrate-binding protein [Verrucomicrobiae bacterium]